MKELSLGKNVSLLQSNIYLVQEYMSKTRVGFSKTLNIILKEWDKYSLEIQKLREREEEDRIKARFDQMKGAKNEKM
jgi:hypothetical protein